ncbi:MAG: hypothetical protein L3J28_06775 [Candidatus Polarisedimenticolaceae bacterium]|nr:hypothetical protein [Candidatus Polarisedimenticolaceae bacterium]
MFDLFKKSPVLDEPSIEWLFEIYTWALRNLGADVFYNETLLVTPSNAHFPGRENSHQGMAQLIFDQVREHAGLAHWPCRLIDEAAQDCEMPPKGKVTIHGSLWGSDGKLIDNNADVERLLFTYDANLVGNPEALIASYAQQLAHHMGTMIKDELPGGVENWLHMTEVLAVMLGFGAMFANTALVVKKSGCGGCSGANRANVLGEPDITYALAIFCVLKGIPVAEAAPHLKSSLRGLFKRAVKDVMGRQEMLKTIPGYKG